MQDPKFWNGCLFPLFAAACRFATPLLGPILVRREFPKQTSLRLCSAVLPTSPAVLAVAQIARRSNVIRCCHQQTPIAKGPRCHGTLELSIPDSLTVYMGAVPKLERPETSSSKIALCVACSEHASGPELPGHCFSTLKTTDTTSSRPWADASSTNARVCLVSTWEKVLEST